MASRPGITRRQTTALGRSGPRSKAGCQACKIRRVRCDEKRPICSHCDRLKLECHYLQPQARRQRRQDTHHSSVEREPAQRDQHNGLGHSPENDIARISSTTGPTSTRETSIDTRQGETLGYGITSQATSSLGMSAVLSATQESQNILDLISGVDSDATTLNNTTSGVIPDFAPTTGDKIWQSGVFNDYVPLPDPSFPFTSLAFTGSLDTSDSIGTHNWRNDIPNVNLFAPDPTTLPVMDSTASDLGTPTSSNNGGQISSWQRFFAPSPPLLSPAQEEMLLNFFERDIGPPASLVGVDPLGWIKIRKYIRRLARDKEQAVLHSLYALSTLLSASTLPIRLGTNKDEHVLFATRLQEAACAAIQVGLSNSGWQMKKCESLLVSVFLLAWFETAYDEENQARPAFPTGMAEKIIVEGKRWDDSTAHILQWLCMLDGKTSHLGGRHLLSESALQIVRESRPGLNISRVEDNESDNEEERSLSFHTGDNSMPKATPPPKTTHSQRLSYLLSSGPPQALPQQVIRMDIFNILLQPAFEFHMTSQAYSRRIGCHDRHHRARGTPEDELDVIHVCMGLEAELQELWKRRPGIINLNAHQLKQFVSPEIARRLEQLFSVYVATFWAHFLYLHRVAFWSLKHTPIVEKALEQTGNMMRRSVGQPMDDFHFDNTVIRTSSNSIHPGLMWTCFMFGCETPDPVQQKWSVSQLRALGKLPYTELDRGGNNGSDELLAFRLDEKGAHNAIRASQLLEVLIDRQVKKGERVDGKYLSLELFGCHFYII